MVAPLDADADGTFGASPANAAATIFVTDPTSQASLPPAEQIAARFGLTATEAEIARIAAMGRGMPRDEAARAAVAPVGIDAR